MKFQNLLDPRHTHPELHRDFTFKLLRLVALNSPLFCFHGVDSAQAEEKYGKLDFKSRKELKANIEKEFLIGMLNTMFLGELNDFYQEGKDGFYHPHNCTFRLQTLAIIKHLMPEGGWDNTHDRVVKLINESIPASLMIDMAMMLFDSPIIGAKVGAVSVGETLANAEKNLGR